MESDWLAQRRVRIDTEHQSAPAPRSTGWAPDRWEDTPAAAGLLAGISRARDYLLSQQQPEGYWCAELEGDTILESEYILLLTFLGQERSARAMQAAQYILDQQLPAGGWAIYPDGPLEISASVKAYWVLKITGHDPQSEPLLRAKAAILAAGGAEKVNSFTRYYMALLGAISYKKCPAVPPELMLIPSWMPFNIYEMSAWSRTIVVPLSLLWAFRPVRNLPAEMGMEELFVRSSAELPLTMGKSENLDDMQRKTWINWNGVFNTLDLCFKFCENIGLKPFRKLAIRRAADWMQKRFEKSDGLGAIFPPIIWSIIGLKCLGQADDSPDVQRALNELEQLAIESADRRTVRLQPCKSPVWDTAIATLALREAGVPPEHPSLKKSVDWLISKEVRQPGDWTPRNPKVEPAGWYFEFNNEFYPDIDDTIMVLMTLQRCLNSRQHHAWNTEVYWQEPSGRSQPAVSAVLSERGLTSSQAAWDRLTRAEPVLQSMRRGVQWVLAMQNKDGGWAAFDRDNDRELFTRVPFADHNAMIDPSTADITARVLEMFGRLGVLTRHPALQRGLDFVWQHQEPDHCWIGRWGINYLYGTWQCLVGLAAVGIPANDSRMQRAANWLKAKQQENGGWGETPRSYDDPTLRGTGETTPSQTAWALLGLCAAGEADSLSAERGVQYLLSTQRDDGNWDEPQYTGTGFPRVFYLRYHMYRTYFPLMALARVARLRGAVLEK